ACAMALAAASPGAPVHAFATRAFMATARMRPGRSASRSAAYVTGAARSAFLVNTPAVAQLVALTSSATSGAPSASSATCAAAALHVGMGYARLAREEYLWARRAFEEAVGLDPEHEDALAGLGEVLLKFGERSGGVACFERILALGFRDDHDLMLQVGRALFR